MKLDVVFTPGGLAANALAGRAVFVIDILRAMTSMCAALRHGARAVVPALSTEDALRIAQTLGPPDVVLAGERQCERIPGFALGNSPREMAEAAVRGKTLVMCTTNGTRALVATQGAAPVYAVAAANLSTTGRRAEEILEREGGLVILCAGREGDFALEDAYCAGRLAVAAMGGRRRTRGLNDAALAALDLVRRYGERWDRPLRASRAGRELNRLGYGEDVLEAGHQDSCNLLLTYRDRRVTASAEA